MRYLFVILIIVVFVLIFSKDKLKDWLNAVTGGAKTKADQANAQAQQAVDNASTKLQPVGLSEIQVPSWATPPIVARAMPSEVNPIQFESPVVKDPVAIKKLRLQEMQGI